MKMPAGIARLLTNLDARLRRVPSLGLALDWLAPRAGGIGLFAAVFVICALLLHAIGMNGLHWTLMQARFAGDPQHQVQAMFLPAKRRDIRLAIVGDSLFHASIPEGLASEPGVERVVINAYDSEDLEDFLAMSLMAKGRLKVRVCHVLAQAMPSFMVRAKAMGDPQKQDLLRLQTRIKGNTFGRSIESVFSGIDRWTDLAPVGDPMLAPHGRVSALIGQARWVDPERENWNVVLGRLKNFDGQLILVEDPRITDVGPDSKLSAALAETVAKTDAEPEYDVTLIGLDDLPAVDVPDCGQG